MKPILITDPHGEQKISQVESDELPVSHRLYSITNSEEGQHIIATGEELDSLAFQWLAYRAQRTPVAKRLKSIFVQLKKLLRIKL